MFSQWMKAFPRLVLSKGEPEFLPGAWFPSALYPRGRWDLVLVSPVPGARRVCGQAGRSLGARAGAPGEGSECGFRAKEV